jgi:hypothetical protein
MASPRLVAVVAIVLDAARREAVVTGATLLSGAHLRMRDLSGWSEDREEGGVAAGAAIVGQRHVRGMAEDDRTGRGLGAVVGHVGRKPDLRRSVIGGAGRGHPHGDDERAEKQSAGFHDMRPTCGG